MLLVSLGSPARDSPVMASAIMLAVDAVNFTTVATRCLAVWISICPSRIIRVGTVATTCFDMVMNAAFARKISAGLGLIDWSRIAMKCWQVEFMRDIFVRGCVKWAMIDPR